jgi:hypothetical protein
VDAGLELDLRLHKWLETMFIQTEAPTSIIHRENQERKNSIFSVKIFTVKVSLKDFVFEKNLHPVPDKQAQGAKQRLDSSFHQGKKNCTGSPRLQEVK